MSVFPHTQLLFESTLAIVISGPHIQILDSRTGDLIITTADRQGADKDALLKSGPIRLAAVDKEGKHLVTSGDDKLLKLWQIDGLKLLNERELPKKPTGLAFTRDGQTILSADKFGDIFSYDLHLAPQTVEQKKASLASHDNPSGGKLILGHASFLTAFLLSSDEKFIITADRDEHIRISWYPQGYTIETYCLGHKKFVSAIHVPDFSLTELVSGGGDPMLKIWDWMTGKVKREIPVLHAVEPFIQVKAPKRTPRRFEEGGEDNGDVTTTKKKGRKGRNRAKQQAKTDSAEGSTSGSTPVEPSEVAVPLEASGSGGSDTILVIQRIASLASDMGESRHLVFSAVGATALFSCAYSEDAVPKIHAFDFSKPVIDFTVASDGLIWVSLDAQWSETGSNSMDSTSAVVRVVRFSGDKLVEVPGDPLPLVLSLNSKCLLPATPPELKALDLYLPLSALPKNNESEHDPMDREALENPGDGKELSMKELGRLKSKKAVAKVQSTGPAGEGEEEELEERRTKRAKSEHDDAGGEDVLMGGL
ncbi:WD40 repeat-like protein [Mycena albidolilacea]|uniref:WD40 repeat-like protein n=1 Tax=Mycena albidolilacea TaxID=1033008 RepID=A0AAD6Z5I8_9AGAR|nr:WD40 repeat-like protein [Mycena albidolilacea]